MPKNLIFKTKANEVVRITQKSKKEWMEVS